MSIHFTAVLCTPDHHTVFDQVDMLTLPGSEGEIGILKDHAPLMLALKPGVITIQVSHIVHSYFVDAGFADISATQCLILIDHFQDMQELSETELSQQLTTIDQQIAACDADAPRVMLIDQQAIIHAKLKALQHYIAGSPSI